MDQNDNFTPKDKQHANALSFIALGGIEDVTKNMYCYEYQDQILLVDCGIGFADETQLGVDLTLPDISYLLNTHKKIVGMVISHGHEDHFGALPFILPQLPNFPVYATPFTAALANEKLKEFEQQPVVQTVSFDGGEINISPFTISFIRITHSVPDSSHIYIKTPVGNFYHAADFKFDLTPADGKPSDYQRIARTALDGVTCLMSDCLGAEREGFIKTEKDLANNFEQEMKNTKGKFIVTTYSSNIARLNQIIQAAENQKRKVCFIGRSLVKAKLVAQKNGYLQMKDGTEVEVEGTKKISDKELVMVIAGSQGQENSAMYRIANNEHKDIKLTPDDTVVFSSDPIPGNEVSVGALIDEIAKRGARAVYSSVSHNFHVSGHGSSGDLMLMMSLTKPKFLMPISGTYKNMSAYRSLAEKLGYDRKNVLLMENGQQILINRDGVKLGKKFEIKNVYLDQVSGEEVESYVLRDREKLAKEGIIILMVEVNSANGQLADLPDIVARGFSPKDSELLLKSLRKEIKHVLSKNTGRVTNWVHVRKLIGEHANRHIFRELRRRPLVLPVIIEV